MLRALFEGTAVGITVADVAGRVLHANSATLAMLGYTLGELRALTLEDLTHPEDWPASRSRVEELLGGKTRAVQIEKRWRRKDGGLTWVRNTVSTIEDGNGTPELIVVINEDITERRRAEEQLGKSVSLLAATIEATADGLLVIDRDFRIEAYNELFVKMWRIPADLLALRDDNRLIVYVRNLLAEPLYLDQAVARMQANPERAYVNRYRFKDGRTLESHVRPRPVAGGVGGWVLSYRDITDRMRVDALREKMLSQIIGAQEDERRRVARELHDEAGQSLTALLISLKLAEGADTTEAAREYIERSRTITLRVMRDIGRLAHGLRPSTLDDFGLVPALERIVRDYAEMPNVRMDLSTEGLEGRRLAPEVEATVYRVVQESITNAVKHSGATRVDVALRCRPHAITACVRDNGKGFEKVALLNDPASRAAGVHGMEERTELLGGRLRVMTRPGEGTSVVMRIPLADREAAS